MTVSETRERFVREIDARVPAERILEAHFFPPLRQGGIESGVAVIAAEQDVADDAASTAAEVRRFTVYTAHYQLTLKGPERGRWEVSVVAEADAPLLTVGAVVRGVERRSGDDTAPEMLMGAEVLALVARDRQGSV